MAVEFCLLRYVVIVNEIHSDYIPEIRLKRTAIFDHMKLYLLVFKVLTKSAQLKALLMKIKLIIFHNQNQTQNASRGNRKYLIRSPVT